MSLWRTFVTINERAIKSKVFVVSVILVVFFRILNFLPILLKYCVIRNGEILLGYSTMELYQFVTYTMFGLIMLVVPVLTYSNSFCNDYSTNHLTYVLMRTSKSRYCLATILTCAISSFLCVFIGEMIVVVGLSCITAYYDVKDFTLLQANVWMVSKVTLLGLQGAFYGVVTMLLSIFTSNKFVIYTSPVLLYFFLMLFLKYFLNVPNNLNPTYIFKEFAFGDEAAILSVGYALVFLLFVIYIVYEVLYKKIERCY